MNDRRVVARRIPSMTDTTPVPATRAPPSIFVLAAVSGLAPLSLNIVVPSIPGLADAFHTDYATAQLVVTAFILSMAIGQLLIGTLSDALGRRPVLLAGIGIYIASSAVCALAPTIEVLVAARVVEAIGGVSGVVLARAIIRDVYSRDQSASALGYVTMVMVVAPMMAPAAGGLLDDHIGWRATFWLMTGIGVSLFVLAFAKLGETNVSERRKPRFGTLLGGFATLLGRRSFLAFTGTMAFASATFFTFLGAAPHVAIELIGNTPTEYGLAFMSISIAFMSGNFTAARLAPRLGTMPLILCGSLLCLAGVFVMAGVVFLTGVTTATLFGSMMIVTYANGVLVPPVIASVVSVRPDLAGAASGLAGSIQFATAALATYVVALRADGTAEPMVWQIGLFAALSLASALWARRVTARS